jgi:F-type H+-transporting ATPase subunit b
MSRLWLLASGLVIGLALSGRPSVAEDALAAPAAGAAAAPHGAAAGGEDMPNILEFKPDLALATVIVFLALLLLLGRFAWGPLSRALEARERAQEEMYQKAEEARAESERMLAEHRQLMAEANDKVRSILEEARKNAEASAGNIVSRAQQEAEAAKVRAERDIAQARDQALSEIFGKTADLAVDVAGKVLRRNIGPEEHRRLIASATAELGTAAQDGSRN